MTKRLTRPFAALMGSAALTLPAFAEMGNEPGDIDPCNAGFYEADLNTDGSVTADELEQASGAAFDRYDADGSGEVTRAEYMECGNATEGTLGMEADRIKSNLPQYDTNNDGWLSQDEFMAAVDEAGRALREGEVGSGDVSVTDDAQAAGDGSDTGQRAERSDEMAGAGSTGSEATPQMAQERMEQGAPERTAREPVIVLRRFLFIPANAPRMDPRDMTRDERAARAAMNFHALDYDYDGRVEADEWAEKSSVKNDMSEILNMGFDEADADKSGSLSREEFTASAERRRQEAEQRARRQGETSDVGAPVVYFRYPQVM